MDFWAIRALLDSGSGYSRITKFGSNLSVDTSMSTVWRQGGLYTWPTAAAILGVSSSDIDDDDQDTGAWTVYLQGLDANYLPIVELVTLNGQAEVNTTQAFLRVNRMQVTSAGSTGYNEGIIYAYNTAANVADGVPDGQILATIDAGVGAGDFLNITHQCIFTLAANEYGLLHHGNAGISTGGTKTADVYYFVRPFGGVFTQRSFKPLMGGGSSFISRELSMGQVLPPKTDIEVRAKASASSIVSVEFDIILVAG
jgi:hypothetical protein